MLSELSAPTYIVETCHPGPLRRVAIYTVGDPLAIATELCQLASEGGFSARVIDRRGKIVFPLQPAPVAP